MSISLSLALCQDENAKTRLQNLGDSKIFLKVWKESECVLQDPPSTDPLLRSVATFRDKILEVEQDGKIDVSDLKSIIADLQRSPYAEVAQYWRDFKFPSVGKFVKLAEISEAVQEFLATSETGSDFAGTSASASLFPLLHEIRDDLKAVKLRFQSGPPSTQPGQTQGCSKVFESLNSCFMQ